ncbi:MAG: tetratricopeptide repeat protein, partial [Cyanobacteria bacterium Co-bin13]|nr:tetratricopeptide repeat protein [Cyanobacteria bacterium Co-bin13]
YEALLALDPKAAGIRWRQIQLLAERDPALAEAEVAALVADSPEDPTVYYFQGELAQQQGDLQRASQAYETILALDPDQLGATSALAGVRFQQGRLGEARRLYEAVLAREPEDWGTRLAIAELNAAQDYRLTALEQLQNLPPNPQSEAVNQRVEELQFDLLRRRGFQPPWERY